ncbi:MULTISPECIES: serine/threonine-protein kinase [unclassified Duganella]|uniref:serine/threonine-protein kinase n=1 Tax=unclassified Duganella TaxID=2636909 RepID=UPI001314B81A|nr:MULTISPECIES: serine/threonine-protein kinase [unclassified Duganella]
MSGKLLPTDAQAVLARSVSVLAGHYELGQRLGEGGYGEVYEAWDRQLERKVAVKRIKNTAYLGDGDDAVREARMAASLQHAAFVKVHAVEDDGHGHAIVMELIQGRTLKEIIQGARTECPTALDLLYQAAEAMRDAHASGLVHGDLKPSNLMVEASGTLRILDFGLSQKYDALATQSIPLAQACGTIAYMAPERLLGKPPDASSDIYALGVILHELIGGKRPFLDIQGFALAAAQLQSSSASWDYPETASQALVSLIRAMTERQAARRVRDMEDVMTRLAQLRRAPAPPATVNWRRQWLTGRRAKAAAATLALLLVAGASRLAPGIAGWPTPPARYSEALEMRDGLAELRVFDRPGSLAAALRHFSNILAHAPANAAAAAGTSLAYSMRFTSDDKDEVWIHKAEAGAQQALKTNDQLAMSYAATGWVLDLQGKHDAAVEQHEHALRLDPNDFFAWYGKAHAQRNARRYAPALQTLASAMTRFPRERILTDELGTVHDEQGNYASAEQAFRRSIQLQPDAVTGYTNLSAILQRLGRDNEALSVLQQGLQIRPSARLYCNLGNALFFRHDYVGAAAAFEQAVSPTRGAPGEYENWVNLADTLLWIPGREQEASHAYDKALKLLAPRLARAPNELVLVSRMALYAARTGDYATAQTLLTRALALGPADASTQFRAGMSYELMGKRNKAIEAIVHAKRLGYPSNVIENEPNLVALRRDPAYPQD